MRITVKLSKQAESTRKNLPIESRSAIDDCIGQLESSTFVAGERNLSNTGYLYLLVYPNWELIIFTREEKRALLTREKIYQVNIIKITTRDYLEDFIIKELVKNSEVSVLARSQPNQVSKLRRLGGLGLLCDQNGCAIAVEVFEGNTSDTSTTVECTLESGKYVFDKITRPTQLQQKAIEMLGISPWVALVLGIYP